MTVIVGIKDEESVSLFSDRGASDSDTIVSMTTPKSGTLLKTLLLVMLALVVWGK